MSRPQKFNPSIGFFGNLEDALWGNQYRQNEIYNEQNTRAQADVDNRTALEQSATDQYLDGVQAQQDITDLYLEMMMGGDGNGVE